MWAALLLGTEINSKFVEAQQLETSTASVVATSTTTTLPRTTTTALSFWAETDKEAARAWAEDAVEYVESLNRKWEDREAAITSTADMAVRVCSQLSYYEDALLLGTGDDLDTETDLDRYLDARLGRSPAQVEADARERYGQERWDLYASIWVESLVYGLCVR